MSKPSPRLSGQSSPWPGAVLPFALPGQPLWLAIYTTHSGGALCSIDIVPAPAVPLGPSTALAETVARQLEAYLQDPQRPFDLPLQMQGSEFQQRLWSALRAVPVGTTQTYGQLAQALRSGAQAVGQACRRNPVPIVVPCHRILAQSGIGGYAGAVAGEQLCIKRALLAHEGVVCG
ncbi:MAG: methylated-DNA--[protein]-cysteine S-methyltransferase [Gammaproteobacteria bacterium]|nr:methylated-DNA--[protein]-cysteine S-methyltransferase [Gammaproteobacteria bacterium]